MTRLIILIFALNAFITPVSAMNVCEMMDGSNPTMMASSMADMDCGMDAETACTSVDCANSCSTVAISPLTSERLSFLIVAGNRQPLAGFVYFYKIILPVSTPPPLV